MGESCRKNRKEAAFVEGRIINALLRKRYESRSHNLPKEN
jgi:hypothetical protein